MGGNRTAIGIADALRLERNPPRCLSCFYVLSGLPENQCPECGKAFDPDNPATFTRRVPFNFWTYWLPAIVLVSVLAVFCAAMLIPLFGFGWGVTIILPACTGAAVTYGTRRGPKILILGFTLIAVAGSFAFGLYVLNFAGIFCGLVIATVALIPISFGMLLGRMLRAYMRKANFSQRDWLPLLLIAFTPLLWCCIEGRHDGLPLTSVRTVTLIDAPPDAVWQSILFYEEVTHERPWLLKLPLWKPLYARGDASRVGGIKVCTYTTGYLAKQITALDPGKSLAFRVVRQVGIQNDSVRLTSGSFELERLPDNKTRLILATTYEPLLTPRPAWYPFEAYAVHTLHGHVMEGMRRKAEALTHAGAAP